MEWFINFNADRAQAQTQKIFRTDNKDLQELLGVNSRYYSYENVQNKISEIQKIIDAKSKDVYTKACEEAVQKCEVFDILKHS